MNAYENVRSKLQDSTQLRDYFRSVWIELPIDTEVPITEGAMDIVSIQLSDRVIIDCVAINERVKGKHYNRVAFWIQNGIINPSHIMVMRALAFEDSDYVNVVYPAWDSELMHTLSTPRIVHLTRFIPCVNLSL